MSVYITELGACLPNAPVVNEAIEEVLGCVADRPSRLKELVLLRNGIKSRHYAIDPATGDPTHSNASLTAEAVRTLTARLGKKPSEIQLLACGTSSPDQFIPSPAKVLIAGPPRVGVGVRQTCARSLSWNSSISSRPPPLWMSSFTRA